MKPSSSEIGLYLVNKVPQGVYDLKHALLEPFIITFYE